MLKSDWSATDFFQNLIAKNKLAIAEGFTFCKVSGLEGFEEALHAMQQATAFCCVSDITDGICYTVVQKHIYQRLMKNNNL